MIKPIGDGAMGQLFHAIRSWRDVAIKILPEAFSQDADRDAEFLAPEKDLAFQPMIPAGTERSRTSAAIWVNHSRRFPRSPRLGFGEARMLLRDFSRHVGLSDQPPINARRVT